MLHDSHTLYTEDYKAGVKYCFHVAVSHAKCKDCNKKLDFRKDNSCGSDFHEGYKFVFVFVNYLDETYIEFTTKYNIPISNIEMNLYGIVGSENVI